MPVRLAYPVPHRVPPVEERPNDDPVPFAAAPAATWPLMRPVAVAAIGVLRRLRVAAPAAPIMAVSPLVVHKIDPPFRELLPERPSVRNVYLFLRVRVEDVP